jgi:hypothetical protein
MSQIPRARSRHPVQELKHLAMITEYILADITVRALVTADLTVITELTGHKARRYVSCSRTITYLDLLIFMRYLPPDPLRKGVLGCGRELSKAHSVGGLPVRRCWYRSLTDCGTPDPLKPLDKRSSLTSQAPKRS